MYEDSPRDTKNDDDDTRRLTIPDYSSSASALDFEEGPSIELTQIRQQQAEAERDAYLAHVMADPIAPGDSRSCQKTRTSVQYATYVISAFWLITLVMHIYSRRTIDRLESDYPDCDWTDNCNNPALNNSTALIMNCTTDAVQSWCYNTNTFDKTAKPGLIGTSITLGILLLSLAGLYRYKATHTTGAPIDAFTQPAPSHPATTVVELQHTPLPLASAHPDAKHTPTSKRFFNSAAPTADRHTTAPAETKYDGPT